MDIISSPRPALYEYLAILINDQNELEFLNEVVFRHPPTEDDWNDWLKGWHCAGYRLLEPPTFKRLIP